MKNILIIDDENSLLFSMKEGFEPYNKQLNILTANNGLEAIDILKAHSVDLVVTDLKMPEMDGFEVIAHLSANHNNIPIIVMTAFNTPEIETQLNQSGPVTIFEKPVDFDDFVKTVIETVNTDSGNLSGISLSSFLQLLESEQKSCLVAVRANKKIGQIFFSKGELLNAIYDDLKGEDAIYKMLEFEEVKLGLKKLPNKTIRKRIETSLMQILLEGTRRVDELYSIDDEENNTGADPGETIQKEENNEIVKVEEKTQTKINDNEKGDQTMGDVKEILAKFKGIEGFMAAGIFTPQGEQVEEINPAEINIAELGSLANDVLLKAQKATDIMGVGRGQLVHIEAPKAHVLARCLNESTDYAATTAGRAHVHMVVVLDQEGNLAMTKMKLASIIQEVAEEFR